MAVFGGVSRAVLPVSVWVSHESAVSWWWLQEVGWQLAGDTVVPLCVSSPLCASTNPSGLAWSHSKTEVQAHASTSKQVNKQKNAESLRPDLGAGTPLLLLHLLAGGSQSAGPQPGWAETTKSQDRVSGEG